MALDIYALVIEQVAGSWWLGVLGLMVIFAIIMVMGNVSFYTTIVFNSFFLLAIAIGYGYPLVTIPLAISIFGFFVYELITFLDRGPGV